MLLIVKISELEGKREKVVLRIIDHGQMSCFIAMIYIT